MRWFFYTVVLTALLILQNCQPFSGLRKETAKAEADSVLFYQAPDVNDPFLDSLSTGKFEYAELHTVLVPPPVEKPIYKWIDGYRVQVFAGLDSLRALQIRQRAASVVDDTVYVLKEKGMYKVQVGDYLFYYLADSVKRKVRDRGFEGAWVAAHKIRTRIMLDGEETEEPASTQGSLQPVNAEPEGTITIQILVTSYESKAQNLTARLNQVFPYPSYYKKANGLFKVYLGKFSQRAAAEAALKQVRAKGYPDAWLVY